MSLFGGKVIVCDHKGLQTFFYLDRNYQYSDSAMECEARTAPKSIDTVNVTTDLLPFPLYDHGYWHGEQ